MSRHSKRRQQRRARVGRGTAVLRPTISQPCIDGFHDGSGGRGKCPQYVTYEMLEFEPGKAAPANPLECQCACHPEFSALLREQGRRLVELGCTPSAWANVLNVLDARREVQT